LEELRRAGELHLRVYSAIALQAPVTEAILDELETVWRRYPDDPLLKTGSVEITLDGDVYEGSAAMLEPFEDDEEAIAPRVDPDALNRSVRLLDRRGWQVMTQASGDRAVRMALNAFEHAARSNAAPERGRRHRVEHADVIDQLDAGRFARLGAIASMQPGRGVPTPENVDEWTRLLGPDRIARTWPYRSLASRKAHVALGSDWPGAPLSPLRAIHTAVTRATAFGQPELPFASGQRMQLENALDGYTSAGAHASFDEQRKGSLTPGMLADMVVLTDDILEGPASRLLTTAVAVTIFDGKVVYRRTGESRMVNSAR
jgi:predicted amidohydrolase YtcJ